MVSSVHKNISAINAFSKVMSFHGQNIANANTDGYKKSRADIVELSHGSVKADVRKVDTPGILYSNPGVDTIKETSNVNLAEELAQTIPTEIAYKSNLKMISAYDELLGSLLDIIG